MGWLKDLMNSFKPNGGYTTDKMLENLNLPGGPAPGMTKKDYIVHNDDGRVRFAYDHRHNGRFCLLKNCRDSFKGYKTEEQFRKGWWIMRKHYLTMGENVPYFTDPIPEDYDPATMPW